MGNAVKLNCDMGESYGHWVMGNDDAIMPWIDMANIACGFHASDPDIMSRAVASAVACNVCIGAHPGYNDKAGFGRRPIPHSLASISNLVLYQAGALDALCQYHGTRVQYIKPHGALYHDMMADPDVFEAIVTTAARLSSKPSLMIQGMSDNAGYQNIAARYSVPLLLEAFADRAYDRHGHLVARSEPGAVHHDADRIKQQVIGLTNGEVITIEGKTLKLVADTVCVHGDNPGAMALIKVLHELLQ